MQLFHLQLDLISFCTSVYKTIDSKVESCKFSDSSPEYFGLQLGEAKTGTKSEKTEEETVKEAAQDMVTKDDKRKCFQEREKCWDKCITSQGDCSEGTTKRFIIVALLDLPLLMQACIFSSFTALLSLSI